MQLRDLTGADLLAWHTLRAAIETSEQRIERTTLDDTRDDLQQSTSAGHRSVVGAFDRADLIGYFTVTFGETQKSIVTAQLDGGVAPHRRGAGVGSALVRAMLARARDTHRSLYATTLPSLRVTVTSSNSSQADLLTEHGFAAVGGTYILRCALPLRGNTNGRLPQGFSLMPLTQYSDVRRLLAVHNQAFADVPGSPDWSMSDWRNMVCEKEQVRRDLSFVVTSGDDIAGYVHTEVWPHGEHGHGREGWIARIGTPPRIRRKGVASALLAHTLAACTNDGLGEVGLEVDFRNATRTLQLYQKAGFHRTVRYIDYALTLT